MRYSQLALLLTILVKSPLDERYIAETETGWNQNWLNMKTYPFKWYTSVTIQNHGEGRKKRKKNWKPRSWWSGAPFTDYGLCWDLRRTGPAVVSVTFIGLVLKYNYQSPMVFFNFVFGRGQHILHSGVQLAGLKSRAFDATRQLLITYMGHMRSNIFVFRNCTLHTIE